MIYPYTNLTLQISGIFISYDPSTSTKNFQSFLQNLFSPFTYESFFIITMFNTYNFDDFPDDDTYMSDDDQDSVPVGEVISVKDGVAFVTGLLIYE